MRYTVAIANEKASYLVLGVTDKRPRRVVNTKVFGTPEALNKIKARIVEKLKLRIETTEISHPDGRVLVFEVPSRPTRSTISL